jgi:hypothetical protein
MLGQSLQIAPWKPRVAHLTVLPPLPCIFCISHGLEELPIEVAQPLPDFSIVCALHWLFNCYCQEVVKHSGVAENARLLAL